MQDRHPAMAFAALALTLLMAALPAHAAGTIDRVRGEAVVHNRDGHPRAARPGERVAEGEALVTGDAGEITLVTDDSGVLQVQPGSRLLIERLQASGTDRDSVQLRLLRGGLQLATGWAASQGAEPTRVITPTTVVLTRGARQDIRIADSGTWVRVREGDANVLTSAGQVSLGRGGLAHTTLADQAPTQPASAPEGLFAPADARVDSLVADATARQASRLQARQQQLQRSGGSSREGNPRVSAQCTPDAPAQRALDELLRAYEQGNLAVLQQRIDPSMPGYGVLINDVMTDQVRQRQMQIHVQDRQMQCGPDVSVIDFAWEKRFLDAATLQPVLQRGRASVLISALGSGLAGPWRISGFLGDSPLRTTASGVADMSLSSPVASYATLPKTCSGTVSAILFAAVTNAPSNAQLTPATPGCTQPPLNYSCNMTSPTPGVASFTTAPATTPVMCTQTPMLYTINLSVLLSGSAGTTVSGPPGSVQPFNIMVSLTGNSAYNGGSGTVTIGSSGMASCSGTLTLPTSTPTCGPLATTAPVQITVRDSARAGQGAVQVLVTGAGGEQETLTLPATSPGIFTLAALPVVTSATSVVAGSGRLELTGPASFTLRYTPPGGIATVRVFNVVP